MRRWLGGHLWTLAPQVRDAVRPHVAPAAEPWSLDVDDPRVGPVRLHGRVRHEPGADTLLLLVHGLGGCSDSPYLRRAASAGSALGWSTLRVDLRGADGRGEDLYHAALAEDLEAAITSVPTRAYPRVLVLGYSLGGHVALWLSRRAVDPRLRAVVAVCAPLDLARSAADIDRTRAWPYRRYVLQNLKRAAREVAARRPLPSPIDAIARVQTLRDWDRLVVAPRHGFADERDYWARASVGPELPRLRVPASWIGTRHDPMVTAASVAPSLAAAGGALDVRWLERGGHVGFPADAIDRSPVETAALRWLSAYA